MDRPSKHVHVFVNGHIHGPVHGDCIFAINYLPRGAVHLAGRPKVPPFVSQGGARVLLQHSVLPDLTIGIGKKGPVPVHQMTQHLEQIWPGSTGSKGRAQIRTQRDKCKGTVVQLYVLEEPL